MLPAMDLASAAQQAHAYAGHLLARPTGIVLVLTAAGAIKREHGDHRSQWCPMLRDILAQDWFVGTPQSIGAFFAAAAQGELPEQPR